MVINIINIADYFRQEVMVWFARWYALVQNIICTFS
jgi:hypothetical protein